jgi:predicted TIM-barrel fold metal-dependent hydrolase
VAAHCQLCSDNSAAFEVMKTTPNIYGDTAWVNMKFARKILTKIGPDRIMFGTDNPIDGVDTLGNPMYHDYFVNRLRLPAHVYHNLMARNAMKVFGIHLKKD